MKKYLLILLVLMAGCHTTKKAIKTNVDTTSETKIEQKMSSSYDAKLINDIISTLNLKITTKEFYPPSPATGADQEKGPLKSETTMEANAETKDKSHGQVKQVDKGNTNINNKEQSTTKTEEKEKPAPDPKRWMWIFLILALIAGGIIYLKKSPILKRIKSVLSPAGENPKI